MDNIKNLREWRAEEIAKIFLLRSDFKLSIDKYPTPLFDFFITLKGKPDVKFAVEVKTTSKFNVHLHQQLTKIKTYRDAGLITIPVLLFKIDEKTEAGELDFLVIPSFKENELLVRNNFQFIELNQLNLMEKINSIVKWFSRTQVPLASVG